MVRILLEPKNSIVRQYQKLFELDGVDLKFTDDAVKAIADKTIARKTGARGTAFYYGRDHDGSDVYDSVG